MNTRETVTRTARASAFFFFGGLSLSGCAAILPSDNTEQARGLHGMWVLFLWSGVVVYIITSGLILWTALRYARRAEHTEHPKQFKENPPLEIIYTLIPLLMVCGLFAVTLAEERHVESLARKPDVTVNVTGFRWSWRFIYPQEHIVVNGTPLAPPQLVLPIGKTTRIKLTSSDVVHAFWVPAFLFKRDAVPGYVNQFDITPAKIGVMRGECVEFCGLDHALMTFTVNVVSQRDFAAWIRRASLQGVSRR